MVDEIDDYVKDLVAEGQFLAPCGTEISDTCLPNCFFEPKAFPREAISKWFKYHKKNPYMLIQKIKDQCDQTESCFWVNPNKESGKGMAIYIGMSPAHNMSTDTSYFVLTLHDDPKKYVQFATDMAPKRNN